jgi:hypothetical protein
LKDGKKSIAKYTAGVWENGEKEKTFIIQNSFQSISKIELGNEFIPDKYKEDNRWIAN